MVRHSVTIAWMGLLVLGLLAGCGAPLATPEVTPAPTSVPPTATATLAPTATATPTLIPPTPTPTLTPSPTPTPPHPLTIESLSRGVYPGSEIVIEEVLAPGVNYDRFLASYRSEGLKIYALLAVPQGEKPETGWPVIVFNHGYIPPAEYRTTERYVAYVDGFARNGYIVFRPDYRGHGSSEGIAYGAYGVPDYTIDVLNAVASLKQYPDADPARIGMWGHSMGGSITLQVMVATEDVRVGVIWAGMVGSYPDILAWWEARRAAGGMPQPAAGSSQPGSIYSLVEQFGSPDEAPVFWASVSATEYLDQVSGPIQIHHGTADSTVPIAWSEALEARLSALGKPVEYYAYPGDDHNLSGSFGTAMARSVAFFDTVLKSVP